MCMFEVLETVTVQSPEGAWPDSYVTVETHRLAGGKYRYKVFIYAPPFSEIRRFYADTKEEVAREVRSELSH